MANGRIDRVNRRATRWCLFAVILGLTQSISVVPSSATDKSDLSIDGRIAVATLLRVLGCVAESSTGCEGADINNDGRVDSADAEAAVRAIFEPLRPATTPSATPSTPTVSPESKDASATPTSPQGMTVIRTPTETPTETAMVTETRTDTPTQAKTNTPTNTPTITRTNTPTDTPTVTATPTEMPTETPTVSEIPTNTPTQTPTNAPTDTPTVSATLSPMSTTSMTVQAPPLTPTAASSSTPTSQAMVSFLVTSDKTSYAEMEDIRLTGVLRNDGTTAVTVFAFYTGVIAARVERFTSDVWAEVAPLVTQGLPSSCIPNVEGSADASGPFRVLLPGERATFPLEQLSTNQAKVRASQWMQSPPDGSDRLDGYPSGVTLEFAHHDSGNRCISHIHVLTRPGRYRLQFTYQYLSPPDDDLTAFPEPIVSDPMFLNLD